MCELRAGDLPYLALEFLRLPVAVALSVVAVSKQDAGLHHIIHFLALLGAKQFGSRHSGVFKSLKLLIMKAQFWKMVKLSKVWTSPKFSETIRLFS